MATERMLPTQVGDAMLDAIHVLSDIVYTGFKAVSQTIAQQIEAATAILVADNDEMKAALAAISAKITTITNEVAVGGTVSAADLAALQAAVAGVTSNITTAQSLGTATVTASATASST